MEHRPTERGRGSGRVIAIRGVNAARHVPAAASSPAPVPHPSVVRAEVLDRLGARLAFERTGIQLYEALIRKLDSNGAVPAGPSRAELEHLRDEEHRHLMLARGLILELGGDPTEPTQRARMQVTASAALWQLVADPRTTLADALDAIMIAELIDHESWEQLATAIAPLADAQAQAQLHEAERAEAVHLARVRAWLAAAAQHAPTQRD
ncbi:MAG TPA: ferritin-like domain-containing protein [Kofleriaceae bacterium]|nr:ferritin-like domain-containing protein [Kofleriaceae bacterium]